MRTTRFPHAALLAVALAGGCREAALPAPELSDMTPSRGYYAKDTRVLVRGSRFYPEILIPTNDRENPSVHAEFSLELVGDSGSTALVGVTLEDYANLRAVVPAWMSPGTYDLRLTTPSGQRDTLEEAFVVSTTQAERLAFDAEAVLWEVQSWAPLTVMLLDGRGERVLDDVEIEMTVEGAEAAWDEGTLGGASVEEGVLRGRLGDDGVATVALSVSTPGLVTVGVHAANARLDLESGEILLQWEPSAQTHLRIDLPQSPFSIDAGQGFPVTLSLVDEFGNSVYEPVNSLLLADSCGSLMQVVGGFVGSAEHWVQVTAASGTTACPAQRLYSAFGPTGASETFRVQAGEAAAFAVEVDVAQVEAGALYEALVVPVDLWGNRTHAPAGALALSDSEGGVQAWSCFGLDTRVCQVQSVVASDALRVAATANGFTGESLPFRLYPGAPVRTELAIAEGPWIAGSEREIRAVTRDSWGNAVPLIEPVTLRDELGELVCGDLSDEDVWTKLGRCALFHAGQRSLWAEVAGLEALSSAITVVNGPLAALEITPQRTLFAAGDEAPLALRAFDAWGNPWLTQDARALAVWDEEIPSVQTEISIDETGAGVGAIALTRAGTRRIAGGPPGEALGRSEPIVVAAGSAVQLAPRMEEPWVWVGSSALWVVEARDTWGNRAALDAELSVCPASRLGCGAQVEMRAGIAAASTTWENPVLGDTLWAQGASLSGQSERFVVARACSDGPVAAASFAAGRPVSCAEGDSARLSFSLGGSAVGGSPVALYAAETSFQRSVSSDPALSMEIAAAGETPLRWLVVDAEGCGDEGGVLAWAGPADGRAVGPISLAADVSALAPGVEAEVAVGPALTCDGLPAAGEVLLRADLGALYGLAATGMGLALELDEEGCGEARWHGEGPLGGAEAGLWAWTPSMNAAGALSLPVTGDNLRPALWSQSPQGPAEGAVSEVVLRFSEPLAAAQPEHFEVRGPYPVEVVAAALDGDTVTLTISPAADASVGGWEVFASRALADLSGHRLDGAWVGSASDYVGFFGAISDLEMASPVCALSADAITPDGDEGSGEEADHTSLSWVSLLAAEVWRIELLDEEETLLRVVQVEGEESAWTFDGRDANGQVLPAGAYELRLTAADGWGRRGLACSDWLTVLQRR